MDRAKVLTKDQMEQVITLANRSNHPLRNRCIVLLSFYCGLRACEISRVRWSMVLDAMGNLSDTLHLEQRATKMRSGQRDLPLHPRLRECLAAMMRRGVNPKDPIIRSQKGGAVSAASIVNMFYDWYTALGFDGASSHSGRRTFATQAARTLDIMTVRDMLGHSFVTTTQLYVDPDHDAKRNYMLSL